MTGFRRFVRRLTHSSLNSLSWGTLSSDDILVGGQAVIEGVMMRSPNGYSVTVRRQDGSLQSISSSLPPWSERLPALKLPVLRGVAVLFQAMILGIRALKFSAEQALADEHGASKTSPLRTVRNNSDVSSWLIAANLVFALGMNIVLFIGLPLLATRLLEGPLGIESALAFNAVDGVIRVLVFLGFLASVSLLDDMRRVFQYHGAEHKTVYNFEARQELTVDNASTFSTLHPRCGTSFLLVVMIVSIVVFSIAHFDSVLAKLVSRIVLLPLVAGISYEIIRYAARRPRSILRFVTMPGLLLQRITTREPDGRQLEVAIDALNKALRV